MENHHANETRASIRIAPSSALRPLADTINATYYVWADTSNSGSPSIQTGSSTVSASSGSSLPTNLYSTTLAQAIAGPNHLGVYGLVGGSGDTTSSGGGSVQSIAEFQDTLLLSNGPTTGFLDIGADIEGDAELLDFGNGYSLTETYLRFSTIQGSGCVGTSNAVGALSECGILEDGPNNYFQLPYTTASDGTIDLGAEFFTFDDCSASQAVGYNSCYVQALFLDTAQIDSITVEDANGNPVPGASVTSLSGVDYNLPQQTAATPEPGSLILLGTGIASFFGIARRRSKLDRQS